MVGLVARMKAHKEKKCRPTEADSRSAPAPIQSISNFVVKTKNDDKEKIDMQVGRMIFATHSSFLMADHPEFIGLCEMLRPGFKPPSRKQIGDRILQAVFEEESAKSKRQLIGENVSMSFDGWSNVRQEPIIGACVTKDNGNVHLVDTIDVSGEPETSENLLRIAQRSIKKTEEEFGCSVRAFVSDSCFAMKSMRKTLAIASQPTTNDQNDDTIVSYGCNSHYLNLLAKDIAKIPNNSRVIGVSIQ